MRKIDFSALDNATAKRLLVTYARDIRALVAQYNWVNVADRADLEAEASLAVLEGYLTYKNNGQGNEWGWITTVIRWRLREAYAATRSPEDLVPNPERTNGADPEQHFLRSTAVRALGALSPRHRIIVDGHMRGETFEEIGASIGLSPQRTHAESKIAFAKLRRVLGVQEPEKSK